MTALLVPIDVAVSADAGFGSAPGFGIFVGNPGPDDSYQQLTGGSVGGFVEGGPITVGFTDMVTQRALATGIGSTGFGAPGSFDEGAANTSNARVMSAKPLSAFGAGSRGTFTPVCFDGTYTTAGGSGLAAGLLLGNKGLAKTGSFALNAATGNQAVTGLGFQPDLVIFLACVNFGANASGDGTNFMLGAMDAAGNQWAVALRSAFFSGHTNLGGYLNKVQRYSQFRNDAAICHIGAPAFSGPTTVNQLASFVSMDADGFTIGLTAAGHDSSGNAMTVLYLAVKPDSGNVSCGVGTQGDTTVAAGFAPDAMLFASSQRPNTTVESTDCYADVGVTDGVEQKNAWVGGKTSPGVNQDAPPSYSYWASASTMRFADEAQTLLAEATSALTGTGAALTWSTDDSVARLFGWIAFQVDSSDVTEATTDPADEACLAATLHGTLTPNTAPGDDVTYWFEWGPTVGYGSTTPATSGGDGSTPVAVSYGLTGLTAGVTYHYRLVVETDGCFTYGDDVTFESVCPEPTTGDATDVGCGVATLNGTITSDGTFPWWFEWGEDTSYGNVTAGGSVTGDNADFPVSDVIDAGLVPGTTYHFRLVVDGIPGEDNTFEAGECPTGPALNAEFSL